MPVARVDADLLRELDSIVGERLSTAAGVREQHGHDESFHQPHPPEVVVFPTMTAEVAAIVAACARHGAPVIPFGTGTAIEGQVAALEGGVCIDLMQMNRVVAVHAEDMDAVVEAGVTRKRLNEHLRDTGLFFPVDPGADASLGGMAATRASGTNAVRYGTMRDNVLALTAVMADGTVIHAGCRARKSSTGYDLARLLVGSEGTLGVITELTLRLHPVPEAIAAAVVSFPDIGSAVDAVVATIQSAVPVARIELLDEVQMDAVNRYSGLGCPVQPTLFLEFHGTRTSVAEQTAMVEAICGEHGGAEFQWATRTEERARLWQARHDAYYAGKALKPGFDAWTTDVCVPVSRLTECIVETKREVAESGLTAPLVGHVGDGNFHLVILTDPARPDQIETARRLHDRLVGRALEMAGTCSGEHGIGLGKLGFMAAEHGAALGVMRAVKRALDPQGIMNPGKLLPHGP
ncbi:MAG: FAD-binding protein [Rhodospirillales bacterium]|nr:FAD-binding protein [Rhodospirillales bacterium]